MGRGTPSARPLPPREVRAQVRAPVGLGRRLAGPSSHSFAVCPRERFSDSRQLASSPTIPPLPNGGTPGGVP